VNAPSEISDLELAVNSQKKIFRLDIPVDHVFAMEI
jgi:hypothetical protein